VDDVGAVVELGFCNKRSITGNVGKDQIPMMDWSFHVHIPGQVPLCVTSADGKKDFQALNRCPCRKEA
jgi:hypothetical protein